MVATAASAIGPVPGFRPPSIPLITQSPLVSVWSSHDTLNGGGTRFWNGDDNIMVAMARVDGAAFLLMGDAGSVGGAVEIQMATTPALTDRADV